MSLLKKIRVLAAKIETTAGTEIAVDATDADYNVFDAMMQRNTERFERQGQGGFGRISSAYGAEVGTCTFKVELTGSGTPNTAPQWALALLPACGLAHSGGTFSPTSEPPGSNAKTVTLALYENGLLKKMRGCAGNCEITFDSGKPIMFDFTFQGAWVSVTDAPILAPTYPTAKPIKASGSTFTIASYTPKYSTMKINLGNVIVPRPSAAVSGGIHSFMISDRRVTGTIDPEGALVATVDNYGKWIAGTEEAFSFAATDGTDTVTFAGPKCERINIQEGEREGLLVDNIEFQFNKSAAAGNDEFTIDF